MRRLTLFLATLTALVTLPSHASSQLQAGPYLAYHDDADLGIGAFVGIPMPALHENISFVGDFGIFFPGNAGHDQVDVNYWEINGDLIYRFPMPDLSFTPWALGGLNIAHGSVGVTLGELGDVSGSNTDIGLNVGGGVTFGSGSMQPFAGVKFELGGGEGAVIFGGLSFAVGGGSQ